MTTIEYDITTESPPGQAREDTQTGCAGGTHEDADTWLLVAADAVDDLEQLRKASVERHRCLVTSEISGEKGGWYGKGLPSDHEASMLQEMMAGELALMEKRAVKALERAMAAHPLAGYVERTKGVGFKAIGRLLASVGDPAARGHVSSLFAYCGVAGPGYRRQKGQKSTWNAKARTRLYVVAESAFRQGKYREVYLAGRAKYVDRDTSDGHKHNMALRLVMREILRDLWNEARERTQVAHTS